MALKHHRWTADEDEVRSVEVPVKSNFVHTGISSAVLEIEGVPDVVLSVGENPGGYKLTATGVEIPPAGVYAWRIRSTPTAGVASTVAKGELHVAEAI